MKNKGLIIAIICLCVTILIATIVISVVIISNTSSINEKAAKELEQEKIQQEMIKKEEEEKKPAKEAFYEQYGVTVDEALIEIKEQLNMTYDNRSLMDISWLNVYYNDELMKMNEIEGLNLWRKVVSEDNPDSDYAIYVYPDQLKDPWLVVDAEEVEGEYIFIVYQVVAQSTQKCIIFEYDENGWYADRMEILDY